MLYFQASRGESREFFLCLIFLSCFQLKISHKSKWHIFVWHILIHLSLCLDMSSMGAILPATPKSALSRNWTKCKRLLEYHLSLVYDVSIKQAHKKQSVLSIQTQMIDMVAESKYLKFIVMTAYQKDLFLSGLPSPLVSISNSYFDLRGNHLRICMSASSQVSTQLSSSGYKIVQINCLAIDLLGKSHRHSGKVSETCIEQEGYLFQSSIS